MEKIQTVTELPFEENILDLAFYVQKINGGKFENYVQAFLLKWALEKKILIIEKEKESLTKKEPNMIFLLEEEKSAEETIEALFWNILLEASGKENKVTDQQLKNLVKEDAMLFISLENKLINDSKNYLLLNGYLEEKERKFLYFNLKKSQSNTAKGDELYNQLEQYFLYLQDLISHGPQSKNEIETWEADLTWISLFGLADKFYSQIKKTSSQQLDIQMGLSKQLIALYKRLSPFLDSFSIGFTYAKNSISSNRSCC
ncbi:hypothetical protein LQF61_11960 [Tetragenococcus koreensis]|uniref:Uncharacterized protein n=1 Tax=Tetragenococcus koreensis TaxID=290335 RepID=A0AAN4UD88_9ENTE|nr:hypothetical protein [Tetragenococcus koreensis]MDN6730410.1 hypothetical protein [Alkalibacterium sp.]AYW44991.1 hypothetical protein C7K43_03025 [Tetragenococcus koreensis]MCF1586307.1 hypothetical protein [Tetragenococcus koreensis]MCF1615874.1 hypothetical protein [Tetragenococcus koreensis]MCF1616392.1 hypothetical protein [Tetragenococcus koreensis]